MPSIVPFGKFFCRFFEGVKFPRDFQGFRPVRTRLLCSDRHTIDAFWMRSARAILVLILASVGLAAAGRPAPVCGAPGRRPCPMQAFMRDQLARPYAERDFNALRANLARLGRLNPDPADWRDWSQFAAEAARAARAQDEAETLKACSSCHRSYRTQYLARYRGRPLGGVAQ
jgi:cytochrome c553